MDELKLIGILKETNEMVFLEKYKNLKKYEKEYKKSDYYKTTRISLLDLYEKYENYYKKEYSIIDKIETFINDIDEEMIKDKILYLLELLNDDERVQELLSSVINKFDVDALLEKAGEVDKIFKSVKE